MESISSRFHLKKTLKTLKKVKKSYTEKINKHVPSGWCVHSVFAYGDVPNLLKMNRDKDCVEKFVEYLEEEVRRLYATFPQQSMTELTAARLLKSVIFASKSSMTYRTKG